MLTLELYLNEPLSATALAKARAAVPDCVRILTLADAGNTEDSRTRLYELVREGVIDDPSNDGTFMPYEQFAAELFEPYYWRWPDCQFLAADSEEWVGLVNLQLRDDRSAEFGVTVVKRKYREKGIARALKLTALAHAQRLGVTRFTTRNDPRNTAVLHLNRSLGFQVRYE